MIHFVVHEDGDGVGVVVVEGVKTGQTLVGWIMDLGWHGEMLNGSRFYDLAAWRSGVLVIALFALLGAVGTWRIHETRCRNIWQAR